MPERREEERIEEVERVEGEKIEEVEKVEEGRGLRRKPQGESKEREYQDEERWKGEK